MPEPVAFMSYAHRDDEAYGGKLSALRLRLQHLVGAALGRDFEIFQDVDGIEWGEKWHDKLDQAIEHAHLLIPILTPSFFNSRFCMREVEKFREMETRTRRRLILPIYFITSRALENRSNPTARSLAEIQYRDLREYRHLPLDAPDVIQTLDLLAARIEDAVYRAEQAAVAVRAEPDEPEPEAEPAKKEPKAEPRPKRREPTVLVGVADRELKPGDVFRDIDAPWCPEMVVIPAGRFLMGSPEGEGDDDERPQHEVGFARPFALGRYPVTFEEYDRFCQQTKRERPQDEGWGRGRRPAINVSSEDAWAYLDWLKQQTGQPYRLPSEAEWEYACRAGTSTPYAFGEKITPEQANFGFNVGKTTEVGAYPVNPWGLFDLHGNVLEWCEDRWHQSYAGAPADGAAWLEGKESGRVLRGGSWYYDPEDLRSAVRSGGAPVVRYDDVGFRVARMLTP